MNKPCSHVKGKASPLDIVSNGLLLLCGLVGLIRTFLSLYPDLFARLTLTSRPVLSALFIPARQLADPALVEAVPLQLTLWAVLLALVVLVVWSLPRFRAVAVTLLAVLLTAAAFRYRIYLVEGAKFIGEAIINQFSQRHGWPDPVSFSYALNPVDRFTGAVLFLGGSLAAIALVLGWAVIRVQRWWLAVLLTLLPILPALVANVYPHWGWFILLMTFWLTMLLGSLCRHSSGRSLLTLISLPAAGLLLAVIVTVLPQKSYVYPQWAYNAWLNITQAFDRYLPAIDRGFVDLPGFLPTEGVQVDLDKVDLTAAGPLNYTGSTVFQVSGNYSGRVYLRGSSTAQYTGTGWEPLEESTYKAYSGRSPLLFPAQSGSAGTAYSITVLRLNGSYTDVYLPYPLAQQDFDQLGLLPAEDSALVSRLPRGRNVASFLPKALDLTAFVPSDDPDFLAEEAAYARFVMEHYTKTDSQLLPLVMGKFPLYGALPISFSSAAIFTSSLPEEEYPNLSPAARAHLGAAQEVARWLASMCEYDPDTPLTPEGEDFAEHFLSTGRGYCMHFATAATLLLRELGVPARYVSGYVADMRSGMTINVPDSAAHAWVEVYLPGYGWYPVEVTPGYDFNGPDVPEEPNPTPSPSPSPTATPSPRPSKDLDNLPTASPSTPPSGGGTSALRELLLKTLDVLAWVGGAAAAFLLLWLGQYLPKRLRTKRLRSHDSNRAVLNCYGWLVRLTRWGGTVDPTALELARKARFSQHTLSEEERVMMTVLFHDERQRIGRRLSPLPGLVFRYLWGVPKE